MSRFQVYGQVCIASKLYAVMSAEACGVQMELTSELLNKCMGKLSRNGSCSTDPKNGKVSLKENRDSCCTDSSCEKLDLSKIISKKQCRSCSREQQKPVKIPETAPLVPGSIVDVDGVDVRVAEITGA